MFRPTALFGQQNGSPFGSPSVFGRTTNPSSDLFKPIDISPFGSATGGSTFGGTSTGALGATSSSSASTSLFGASSSPTFGSSTPALGSSLFEHNPAFGGFGSTVNQSNRFGGSFQQTQSPFGRSAFGSFTPFGASSQIAFGATSGPAFGTTNTATFGAASTPTFGRTSAAFGVSSAAVFGSAGAFGNSSTVAFGASTSPAYGIPSTPAFSTSSTPGFSFGSTPTFGRTSAAFGVSSSSVFGSTGAFGNSSTVAFGASTSPAYGIPSTPAFSASSTPGFSFGSTPTFGQLTSAAGSGSLFGPTTSPFAIQTSDFVSQTPKQSFGLSAFGGQRGGSRVISYTATAEVDGVSSTQPAGKLVSISAMPIYREKNNEELRWEDYQLGDKGGRSLAGKSASGIGFSPFPTQSNPFSPSPTPGQPSMNAFLSSINSNLFSFPRLNSSSSGSGISSAPTLSSTSFANPLGTTSSFTPSKFGPASVPALELNSSSSLFGTSSPPTFQSSPSIFTSTSTSTSAPATTSEISSGLSFANTQSPPQFQSASSLGQTRSIIFGPGTAPSFSQTNMFSAPSTGSGFGVNLFSSIPSLLSMSNPETPPFPTPFVPAQAAQTAGSSGIEGITRALGQSISNQPSATLSTVAVQPSPVMNPFGTQPVPRMPIGFTPSIQYGISSMPVSDKPASVRISSLLTIQRLSQRQIRFPTRKYDPKTDGSKVPFFIDDKAPSTPKEDALFPRENPRALVIRPMEQWSKRANTEKMSLLVRESFHMHENGNISGVVSAPVLNSSVHQDKDENSGENGTAEGGTISVNPNVKPNQACHDSSIQRTDLHVVVPGHKDGEAERVHKQGLDVGALMPKLRHTDYYTEPQIQELAMKERAEPGFCCCVKDFVVGRHGYGSIKFWGETDVRQLDLESHVQFNNREVIVYIDEYKKPPVGQGLNKPAEVTLLNIKCIDKKTGKQYTDGPKVDKYREMLIKKATDQGAEFVSYNPEQGEWKFRVRHFN